MTVINWDDIKEHESAQVTSTPDGKVVMGVRLGDYFKTDLGNAQFFRDRYLSSLRYDHARRRWLQWRGHRWEPDALKRAEEAAQSAAIHRYFLAQQLPAGTGYDPAAKTMDPVTKIRDDELKWAMQCMSRLRIDNAIALAQKMSEIAVDTSTGWDSQPWLLGVPNGVVDLRKGQLRDGAREDQITKQTGVRFDLAAKCPRWEKFLLEVLDGDKDVYEFVRKSLGYTLTGDLREDCWFGCYGTGSNGKSTMFKVLHEIFGDYSYVAPFSLVERGKGEKRDFDIAYLQNMRFVMASETSEGGVWDEERLKRLTGGDPLHAEIKHGAEFEFLPTHKLWFMFNHQPRVRDHSVGFWRRVRLIPFLRKFEGSTADKTLDAKLHQELPGILIWLVQACLDWQREGVAAPSAVMAASQKYEVDEDPLNGFVQKHLRLDGTGFALSDAYKLYKEWCKDEYVDHSLGKSRFGSLLEPRGFKRSARRDTIAFENGRIIRMCVCMTVPCKC